jgi:hypothetical protein
MKRQSVETVSIEYLMDFELELLSLAFALHLNNIITQ